MTNKQNSSHQALSNVDFGLNKGFSYSMCPSETRFSRIPNINYETHSRWSTRIEGNETTDELLMKIVILIFDVLWMPINIVFFDEDYMWWFAALPLIIFLSFFTPLAYLVFFQFWSLYLRFIKRKFQEHVPKEIWYPSRKLASILFWIHGKIMHGHEFVGLENIPENGPAVIIFYHSPLPVDIFYLLSACYLYRKRVGRIVADNSCSIVSGWKESLEVWTVCPNTLAGCLEVLKNDELILLSPGGITEMIFSESDKYNLMWNDRLGFAKLIQLARVPVIPMFTENCREYYRTPVWAKGFLNTIYKRTKFLFLIMYGEIPVKSVTHIGTPISYDAHLTLEQRKDTIKKSLENLIKVNQKLPGSILRGLVERIYHKPKRLQKLK